MSRPGIFRPPSPRNEPVQDYLPGSPERAELEARLAELRDEQLEIPCVIGGEEVRTGDTFDAVMPHDKGHVLAQVHKASPKEVERAVAASADAWEDWHRLPWEERAAVFLRAAELLAGPWRPTLVAATMLNQSKTAHQAEIDAACEVIDFWRFNVEFMVRIYEEQPISSPGVWNRLEYRPLEGFVFAISPFNFTAIGANLTASPALMGDVVLWKPASTAAYSSYWTPEAARGSGAAAGRGQLLARKRRGRRRPGPRQRAPRGIHFTGSTEVFHSIWKTVGENIDRYRQLPADRGRDRRQGLHRRPPERGRRRRSRPRSCVAHSSTRARSARRPRASTHPRTCGRSCASGSSRRSARSRWATSPTSRTSWGQ
jgi:1-pyrroline-5-carboxylate dehydrogenase